MSAAAEKRAADDAVRHAEQFRRAHGVTLAEWDRAEAMTEDYLDQLRGAAWILLGFTEDPRIAIREAGERYRRNYDIKPPRRRKK